MRVPIGHWQELPLLPHSLGYMPQWPQSLNEWTQAMGRRMGEVSTFTLWAPVTTVFLVKQGALEWLLQPVEGGDSRH